ncbi:MAG: DUF4338 domain-containing protein [Candidatus Thermoplasmatota archaeon]|nr:DUF4338 domain-containing protein [Candidatus Thermoplasmatota archaeon]
MEHDIEESATAEQRSLESRTDLRYRVLESLVNSGFSLENERTLMVPQNKEFIRMVHANAVGFLRERKRKFIKQYDETLLEKCIIDGKDLDVHNIQPVLRKIDTKFDNAVFNWVKLHWSIPTSAGYGRRLRYIVYDRGNSAVIGIIGLADPVFALGDRDRYIGWNADVRKRNLKHLMDAFVLGAVPPYSMVLGGKLVASMLLAPQIVKDFRDKYRGKRTIISNEIFDGKLAAITTTSALGKSSVYDRIKIPGTSGFEHVGWSRGSGEFQFFNGVYDELFEIAHEKANRLKNKKWGSGVRNRRTVIRTGLELLGLPTNLLYHNIRRELFLVPLGRNSKEFLAGKTRHIEYYHKSVNELSTYALKRWVTPRAERIPTYLEFYKESYSLRI